MHKTPPVAEFCASWRERRACHWVNAVVQLPISSFFGDDPLFILCKPPDSDLPANEMLAMAVARVRYKKGVLYMLWIILALIACLAVIFYRAYHFHPKPQPSAEGEAAVRRLRSGRINVRYLIFMAAMRLVPRLYPAIKPWLSPIYTGIVLRNTFLVGTVYRLIRSY